MPAVPDDVQRQLGKGLAELSKRAAKVKQLDRYYGDDECAPPYPEAVVRARMTTAYRTLMPMAGAPWGSLVVDSVQDRLEVAGIRSADKQVADAAWEVWQNNAMDAESKLAHHNALVHGRAFATVWPGEDGEPEIVLDGADQMVVLYREGSRRHRVVVVRGWLDEDTGTQHATLYRPDGIFKFRQSKEQAPGDDRFPSHGTWWEAREVDGEDWPLPNRFGVMPVVELAVNRRLRAGVFPYARGEFQLCTGLLDRIHLLTFLGLVVAIWMGFPLRGVIGDKIIRDDAGDPLPPFNAEADSIVQLENPNARFDQYDAADRKNLSIFPELAQFAYVTKTPAHYFPMDTGLSNLSADAIRALEGGLHAKVTGHKASLGEGHEEVLRLGCLMRPDPVILPRNAELLWKEHESRSLAERADAATKLKDLLPWQAVAERALNASQDEIARWQSQRAGDAITTLLTAAAQPAPLAVSGANGNGSFGAG